jgi:hypothetical protein
MGAGSSRAPARTAKPAKEDAGTSWRPPSCPWATGEAPESGIHFSFKFRTREAHTRRDEYLGPDWARSRGGQGELAEFLPRWGQMKENDTAWPTLDTLF